MGIIEERYWVSIVPETYPPLVVFVISTSISPRLAVKVRMTVESMDSYIAEIGTSAGERGISFPGIGKGLITITVSAITEQSLATISLLRPDNIIKDKIIE